MKRYFADWNSKNVTLGDLGCDRKTESLDTLIPAGLCPSAFITCYPYAWTFEHRGWFRWVVRNKPMFLWRPENKNLTHSSEVLVVCPNPENSVLFGISPAKGGTRIQVRDVKGFCPHEHQTGQQFFIKKDDSAVAIYYQLFPYYCAEATRSCQSQPFPETKNFSSPSGQKVELPDVPENRGCSVCMNSQAVLKSGYSLSIDQLRMPCRYQRSYVRFRADEMEPMGKMCLDAAWSLYPAALATLYDARPRKGQRFTTFCPGWPDRVLWEVESEKRYHPAYETLRRMFFKFWSRLGICVDRPDRNVNLRVKKIHGQCPAGHQPGEAFNFNIFDQSRLCPGVFSQFYPFALLRLRAAKSKWPERAGSPCFSCPDFHGANYLIERSWADDMKLRTPKPPRIQRNRKVSPQNWQSWYAGKTVVITGGNSGIGYEMAIEACKAGAKTFICGRDENTVSSSLEMLRAVQPDADGMVANLIDPDGFAAFIGKLKKLDDIHILINNAGIGDFGVVAVAEPENLGRMVRTNVEVLTVLTAKLLPAIKAHGTEGGILNLGSILSWFPSPGSAAYSATKSFALNFTEALRYELKEDGVHVCGLYPGGTRSRFAERAGLSEANKEIRLEQPSFVAREGLKGLALNKPRIIPGKMIKVKTVIMRLMPARIRSKIV